LFRLTAESTHDNVIVDICAVRIFKLHGAWRMGHGVKGQVIFYRLCVCPLDMLSISVLVQFQAGFILPDGFFIHKWHPVGKAADQMDI
jgi:hypothetical protein